MRRGPARGATHPRPDARRDRRVRHVPDDGRARDPEARRDVRVLPVAVRRLVEVHEVEVDRVPRQLDVRLRVQVQERLAELVEARDPHLRGAERVHPRHDAQHAVVRVGVEHRAPDRVGVLEHGLPDHGRRDVRRRVEEARDLLRLLGDLPQRLLSVQVLAAGEEPDLAVRVGLAHVRSISRVVGGVRTAAGPSGLVVLRSCRARRSRSAGGPDPAGVSAGRAPCAARRRSGTARTARRRRAARCAWARRADGSRARCARPPRTSRPPSPPRARRRRS